MPALNTSSHPKKVEDSVLVESYQRTGNVHVTGAEVGLNHSSVHERLTKLGVVNQMRVFTDVERKELRDRYLIYRNAGKLGELAERMGRTKHFLCRQARELGLTDPHGPKKYAGHWKYMDAETAHVMMDDFKASNLGLLRYCSIRGYGKVGFWRTMTDYFGDEWEFVIESKQPRTTKYRRGRAFEYTTRRDLQRRGYFVTRSPASRSPIDLVAIKLGIVLFVQCKISGALPPRGWNELYDLALSTGSQPILAERAKVRCLKYRRLVGRKDGSKRSQPFEIFDPGVVVTPVPEDSVKV